MTRPRKPLTSCAPSPLPATQVASTALTARNRNAARAISKRNAPGNSPARLTRQHPRTGQTASAPLSTLGQTSNTRRTPHVSEESRSQKHGLGRTGSAGQRGGAQEREQ